MTRDRAAVLLAVGALFSVACADTGPDDVSQTGQSSASPAPTGSTAPPPSTSPATPVPAPRRDPAPPTQARRPAGPPSAPAPDAFVAARGAPGTFAPVLLKPQPATRLVLEVLQEQGAGPRAGTVSHLVAVLQQSSGKPVSVSTVLVPSAGGAVSPEGVRSLGDGHGRATQGGGQAVVRMLFLGGRLQGEDGVLGAAVRGDTAAVFVDQVRSSSSPLVSASALEQAVAAHELGHLLGLVDLFLSTGRADPEHPGHSPDRGSVMYWAVESDLVTSILAGPPPVDFDAADRADLAAIRSGS